MRIIPSLQIRLKLKLTSVLREMDGIYSSLFINYGEAKDDLTIGEYGDILVICTDRDEDAIQPYIDWKMEKGFNVSKEVVATGTNVKTLIQDAYDANNNSTLCAACWRLGRH